MLISESLPESVFSAFCFTVDQLEMLTVLVLNGKELTLFHSLSFSSLPISQQGSLRTASPATYYRG